MFTIEQMNVSSPRDRKKFSHSLQHSACGSVLGYHARACGRSGLSWFVPPMQQRTQFRNSLASPRVGIGKNSEPRQRHPTRSSQPASKRIGTSIASEPSGHYVSAGYP